MGERTPYETDQDRVEEDAIAKMVCEAWSCAVVKLPRAYNLDRAILRDREVMAWAEIKRRKRTLEQYPSVFLSMQKVFAAHNFHLVTGKPCLFIIKFDDCLAYADMLPKRKIEFRGRVDRGDWQDQEAAAVIPTREFKLIRGTTPSKPQKVCLYSDGCPPDGPVCHLCTHVQPGASTSRRLPTMAKCCWRSIAGLATAKVVLGFPIKHARAWDTLSLLCH